jgi:hypothetical protein
MPYYCKRWFYDRDWLCVNKSQFVPVIFEPPCIITIIIIIIIISFMQGIYTYISETNRDSGEYSVASIL